MSDMLKRYAILHMALMSFSSFSYGTGPLQEQVSFQRGWWGHNTFRISALLETQNGVVLAFAEGRVNSSSDTGNIDTVLRRELDGDQT